MNEFERDILNSIIYYQSKGIFIADKIIERVTFGKSISYGISKFDFWALYKSKFFAIEAKSRKTARMPVTNNISDHQISSLLFTKEHGGLGLLAFRYMRDNSYYSFLGDVTRIIDKKSIKLDEALEDDEWYELNYTEDDVYDLPSALDFFLE